MDPTTVLLLVALLVITVLLVFPRSAKRARLMRLLNKIPGPPSYPLVGTVVPFVMAPRNKRHYVMLDRLKEYQPILCTWIGSIPTVHIVLPEHAEILLNNVQHLDKSYGYKFLHPWLGTGLLTSTGSKWHSHRKMITPTFHFKILDNFVEVFSEKSEILVQKLRQELTSPGFDVYPYVTRCALDIICETAMGTEVNAQEHNSQYVSAVYDMSELLMKRMTRPWLQTDWLYNLTKDGQRYFECLRVLHSFTNQVIQDRKCSRVQTGEGLQTPEDDIGKKRRVAFLDMLLEASEAGSKLTDEEIREEVDTFMFEGHDTTSAAISWALFLLGLHPRVQDKAWEELDSIFQGSDRPPTMKDLNEMKYLERVIKESLRLYPSVPFFSRNLSQDLDIGGHTIPADTAVRIHVDFLHRNPDQFPDPEVFNPDNFLPERVMERHPYAYIPFSAGPRNCIGQKFALLEEKTVLSYILRRYRLRSLQTREDVDVIAELIMKPHEGIPLVITPR